MSHLPGLLDDPLAQVQDLPDQQYQIAPLRDPRPLRGPNTGPFPLEPSAGGASEEHKNTTKLPSRRVGAKVTVGNDFPIERTVKPTDISSLLDPTPTEKPARIILPSFVSLAAVENRTVSVNSEDARSSKRARVDFDDLLVAEPVRLPTPPDFENNKRKDMTNLPAPPTYNVHALHQPPPNPSLLPPIDPDPVYSELLGKMNPMRGFDTEYITNAEVRPAAETSDSPLATVTQGIDPTAKKPRRQVRKWTPEETTELMKGVQKYGIGKWKEILDDPECKLEPHRTAVDLKDRFRVCCPEAYKARPSINEISKLRPLAPCPEESHSQTSDPVRMRLENLLTQSTSLPSPSSAVTIEGNKPENSRKAKLSDEELAQLGIQDAVAREKSASGRRRRRLWTKEEDEKLLKGMTKHGFAWTAMQEDRELNLSHRKATDLRDRVRNLFPDEYRNAGFKPVRSKLVNQPMTISKTEEHDLPIATTGVSVSVAPHAANLSAFHNGIVTPPKIPSPPPPPTLQMTPRSSQPSSRYGNTGAASEPPLPPPPPIAVDQLLARTPPLQPSKGDQMLPSFSMFGDLVEQNWDPTLRSPWDEDPL